MGQMDEGLPVLFYLQLFLGYFFLNHGTVGGKGAFIQDPADILDAEVQSAVKHDA